MGSSAITSSDTTKTLFWRMQNLPHCWIVLDNLLVLFTHKATIIRTPKPPRRNAERNRHLQTCRNLEDSRLNCSAVVVHPFPSWYRCSKTLQFKLKVHMTDVFTCICVVYVQKSTYLWRRRAREGERERERQIERKNKNTSDQTSTVAQEPARLHTSEGSSTSSLGSLCGSSMSMASDGAYRKTQNLSEKGCSNSITILKMPKHCMLIQ